MDEDDVVGLLLNRIEKSGSQKAWADMHGVSAPYVSAVITGRAPPAGKILRALGVERVTMYRVKQRKGAPHA
jgi:DNA-binding transcriptional regulator YdaS (Cro superfamily)